MDRKEIKSQAINYIDKITTNLDYPPMDDDVKLVVSDLMANFAIMFHAEMEKLSSGKQQKPVSKKKPTEPTAEQSINNIEQTFKTADSIQNLRHLKGILQKQVWFDIDRVSTFLNLKEVAIEEDGVITTFENYFNAQNDIYIAETDAIDFSDEDLQFITDYLIRYDKTEDSEEERTFAIIRKFLKLYMASYDTNTQTKDMLLNMLAHHRRDIVIP